MVNDGDPARWRSAASMELTDLGLAHDEVANWLIDRSIFERQSRRLFT